MTEPNATTPAPDRRSDGSESVDITAAILEFIQKELLGTASGTTVTPDDDLLASGIVDSMGVMRLVAHIEKAFSIVVPPEDVTIENFVSVRTLNGYVLSRLAEDISDD